MLTLETFNKLSPGDSIATGVTTNSQEGINVVDSDIGREMKWVATKVSNDMWTIRVSWKGSGPNYILPVNGILLSNKESVLKLIPCTNEIFEKYRC